MYCSGVKNMLSDHKCPSIAEQLLSYFWILPGVANLLFLSKHKLLCQNWKKFKKNYDISIFKLACKHNILKLSQHRKIWKLPFKGTYLNIQVIYIPQSCIWLMYRVLNTKQALQTNQNPIVLVFYHKCPIITQSENCPL